MAVSLLEQVLPTNELLIPMFKIYLGKLPIKIDLIGRVGASDTSQIMYCVAFSIKLGEGGRNKNPELQFTWQYSMLHTLLNTSSVMSLRISSLKIPSQKIL